MLPEARENPLVMRAVSLADCEMPRDAAAPGPADVAAVAAAAAPEGSVAGIEAGRPNACKLRCAGPAANREVVNETPPAITNMSQVRRMETSQEKK